MTPVRYLSLVFGLFIINNLAAQEALLSMDTIQVQTTRLPQRIAETGRNISLIDAKLIEQMAFNSVDELLQYIPGVELQSRNAFGAQADISIRGATFTQVLVLLDGMKLNDPLTAHFNAYLPITPPEIARIEVLRGPAAALYGPDAVGGIVHIITKAFSAQQKEEFSASGQINYGQHNLINAWQGLSMKKDRLHLVAGVNINQSDGEFLASKALTDSTELEGYHNYFNIKTISSALSYELSDKTLISARTAYDYRDFSARYFYTTSTFDKSRETTRNWWNQVQISQFHDKGKTQGSIAYKFNTDQFIFSPDFPSTNEHETTLLNMQLNHLQRFSSKLAIHAGIQADRRTIVSNDRGNHEDWHGGVYAMTAFQPIKQWHINASLRLDYDENYDFEWSPQLNIAYELDRIVLRGSVGKSIRAADYTERYVSTQLENLTSGRSLGNPNLKAEQSWSEELGVDVNITKQWQVKATAFFRQSEALIDYVATEESQIQHNENLQEGATYFFASNVSEVQTNGLELESWLNTKIGHAKLLWLAGYTYLHTRNEEEVVSVYISSHAKHLLNTSFTLSTPRFEGAISGLYKVRDPRAAEAIRTKLSKQYQIWNLRLEWKILPAFGFNLQVHNLFDEKYQDVLGAPMPGRWLMGGLRFRI